MQLRLAATLIVGVLAASSCTDPVGGRDVPPAAELVLAVVLEEAARQEAPIFVDPRLYTADPTGRFFDHAAIEPIENPVWLTSAEGLAGAQLCEYEPGGLCESRYPLAGSTVTIQLGVPLKDHEDQYRVGYSMFVSHAEGEDSYGPLWSHGDVSGVLPVIRNSEGEWVVEGDLLGGYDDGYHRRPTGSH